MNSKLREAIPDIVHRHGLTLDHELREGKTIGEAENTATTEAEKAIRQAIGEELGDELLTNIPNNINDYAEKVSQFIQRLKGGEDD